MKENFWISTFLPSIISFAIIYVWSKKWDNKPLLPDLSKINKQANTAIIVLVSTFILFFIGLLISSQNIRGDSARTYGIEDFVEQTTVLIVLLIPMFIAVIKDNLKLSDLQLRNSNRALSLVLGIISGLLFLIFSGRSSRIFSTAKATLLFAGLQYLIVAFAEEILFRGYIQVRFVARWGFWKGFLLTSVIFCFWHLPTYSIGMRIPLSVACIEVIKLIPLSLLLGYSLEKTGNIITPVLIHLFLNWVQI